MFSRVVCVCMSIIGLPFPLLILAIISSPFMVHPPL